jgi:hypothetical protein
VCSFPDLQFITCPINVQLKNERAMQRIKQFEPFSIEYEIRNATGHIIDAQCNLMSDRAEFLVAGELQS